MADWGLPGQFTALEVANGVLNDVGQGRKINFAQKIKKRHELVPLSLAKKRQPIPAYTGVFLRIPAEKGAPPPPILFRAKLKAAKAKEKGKNTASKMPTSGSFTPVYATNMRQTSAFLAALKPGRAALRPPLSNKYVFSKKYVKTTYLRDSFVSSRKIFGRLGSSRSIYSSRSC